MILFKRVADIKEYLNKREPVTSVGFVPTMGALHAGHISLVKASVKKTGLTVCSIFVNPTQFNDPQDFERYPVTIASDIAILEAAGCDVLFLPPVDEIYPDGTANKAGFELGYLETTLEGKYRPGHFQGVCQVVNRLLGIVSPDVLFLGRKDYQQCMVIRRLIEITGRSVQLEMADTRRETSGLAMSSRNQRLSEADRERATAIFRALLFIKQNLRPGVVNGLTGTAETMLTNAGFEKIDYVSIADAGTLTPLTEWDGHTATVALIAAFIGGVRLIDNMPLN